MGRASKTNFGREHTGVQTEMTFRGIAPLDELVQSVRAHASSLEPLCSGTAVCRVGVHGIAPTRRKRRMRYLVEVRLSGRDGHCEVCGEGTDLFETVATTFDRLEERLREPMHASATPVDSAPTEAPVGEPHDGWIPVRTRRADESMRDLPL